MTYIIISVYSSDMDRVFYLYDITLSHDIDLYFFMIHHGQKMKSIVYDMPMNTIYFFDLLISIIFVVSVTFSAFFFF